MEKEGLHDLPWLRKIHYLPCRRARQRRLVIALEEIGADFLPTFNLQGLRGSEKHLAKPGN